MSILPTADLGLSDEIHLSSASNVALGQRLALQMNEGVSAPDVESIEAAGQTLLRLRFANVKGEMIRTNTRDAGEYFEVTDELGAVPVENVKAEKDCALLTLSRAVRGAARVSYERECMRGAGSLKDSLTLLPALPFLNETIH